jgi:hypothetical protein
MAVYSARTPVTTDEELCMRTRIFGITLLTMFAALAALAAPSQARDRNHDRIGDKWEKRHHLSLHVNQARRDQDHDGLKNRGEFRAQTDPRDDDSDNDGVEDGDEQAGTVASFANGTLTVNLFGGGSITGQVTSATEIECDTGGDDDGEGGDDDDQASKSSLRSGDEHGDDDGEQGDDNEQGDDHESDDEACPAGALKEGAIVQEAELKLSNGSAVFEKIELLG